jgi:hypothetical protein
MCFQIREGNVVGMNRPIGLRIVDGVIDESDIREVAESVALMGRGLLVAS